MRQKSNNHKDAAERTVKDIRRRTRKTYSAEEKIRIVLAGLRGEESIASLCRQEGIAESLYYSWSKEFLEAGKQRLAGDTARQASSPEVKALKSEASALKEAVADLTLENRSSGKWSPGPFSDPPHPKKSMRGVRPTARHWFERKAERVRRMRYSASEKLEIIRTVDNSHLPAKRTLDMLGIPRTTFYRWYDKYLTLGAGGLEDRTPTPGHVWNRIPDTIRGEVVDMALEEDAQDLSPRELATRFTDQKAYYVSGSSVYRILKAHDLITSPAHTVIKAADEFRDKTTAINQLWQTEFTYFKITGWGWYYLSTILDDYSRYIISWRQVDRRGQHDEGR